MRALVGERKAIAAAALALYAFLFTLVSLAPPPGWGTCFGALAGVYWLGFTSVVAGYFWGRWFATGLGLSGALSGAISVWQVGPEPVLLFYAGTHGLVALALWGRGMASNFDGRKEWRKRFHLDDSGTQKLGKAIVRASVSLPYVLMYALAPKEGANAVLVLAGMSLAGIGVWGLFRLRTWGIVSLASAATVLVVSLAASPDFVLLGGGYAVNLYVIGCIATVLLASAVVPFAKPMMSFLRQRLD